MNGAGEQANRKGSARGHGAVRRCPNVLLIGSSGRNSGKTHVACEVIKNNIHRAQITGLKVTVIAGRHERCPRGGEGCGACSSLEGDFSITEETGTNTGKDTARLLKAGAKKVFWLRVLKHRLHEGIEALFQIIPESSVIVAESNRLRLALKPGLFLMVSNTRGGRRKESAALVWKYADFIVHTDGKEFDIDISRVILTLKGWTLRNTSARCE